MNSRQQIQSMINNSVAIRQEIQRFESVHPSIYAIYDLIELIPDTLIAQQIRDHVVCIEDSFVNSQEWTVARAVPDLRLGIVGALSSGKSALVHRYLTGSYMQEESPEGGRFKKEVVLDGQSHLLLIRDEGGAPEHQFSSWVDAVIFVFSLESEASFNAIYGYYTKMAHFRNSAEVPLILVGTQDAISETNPRVIDDARARKLAADLKRCSYYETCATYGLNVERVFQDACHKIVQQRLSQSTTCLSTPVGSRPTTPVPPPSAPAPALTLPPATQPQHHSHTLSHKESGGGVGLGLKLSQALSSSSHQLHKAATDPPQPPTPSSTPTATRKNRRRSNLFTPSKKAEERVGRGGVVGGGGEVGVGRAIPLKQGYLYKRSSKALNKEWKKKYVTLCDDGRLTYHPSLHDYMDDVHGKEISLQYVTVKVPGQRPRGSSAPPPPTNGHHPHPNPTIADSVTSLTITSNCYQTKEKRVADKVLLTAYELLREPGRVNGEEPVMLNNALYNGIDSKAETPNVKKRHRRVKSSIKNQECEDSDGFEFLIVSLDNKQWQFEASNSEERDDWVAAIEQQILNSLQGNESSKAKTRLQSSVESAALQTIRDRVPGNTHCVDCDAPNPEWASLNLGVVMCIECCGVHRNLGSHISRVRSLHLDEWPPGHLAVMLSVGNAAANRVWEGQGAGGEVGAKPTPSSSREEKDRWIRAKYEARAMLPPMPPSPAPHRQLVFAVCRNDMWSLLLLLAHGGADLVNAAPNEQTTTTALHLACAAGNLAVAQLLIWYNANVKAVDKEGRTCLGLARAARAANPSEQSGALVELLQSLGCPEQATNLTQIRHSVPTLDNLQASVI